MCGEKTWLRSNT